MNLFNYLMSKKGHNTSVRDDLFAYLLSKKENLLPKEYKKVQYIESNGTQYIDLSITGEASWEFTIQYTRIISISQIFLGRASEAGYWFGILNENNSGFYGFGASNKSNVIGTTEGKCLIETLNDKINGNVNNENIPSRSIGSYTYLENSYRLFGAPNSSTYNSYCKLYELKCYQNNNLICNLVPCYRKIDNKPGLYDIVNHVFYVNQGTDEFLYE